MANKQVLKAFYRLDSKGRPVLGSLILRQKMPKVGRWVEAPTYQCCTTTTTTQNPD